MRRIRRSVLGVVPVLALLSLTAQPAYASGRHASYPLSSPDGSIRLQFELDRGAPSYSVAHHRRPLVVRSALGLQFQGTPALDGDFVVRRDGDVRTTRRGRRSGASTTGSDTARQPAHGRPARAREPRRTLRLVFRAYDDGVAFRYVIPGQRRIGDFAMTAEETQFNFAADFDAWWIPAQFGAGSGDEELFRTTPLSQMQAAATPVTINAGAAGYATLHEADLIDYATMMVEPAGSGAPSVRSARVRCRTASRCGGRRRTARRGARSSSATRRPT